MFVLLILSRSFKDFELILYETIKKKNVFCDTLFCGIHSIWSQTLYKSWLLLWPWGGANGPWEELGQQGCGYGPVGGAMCLLQQGRVCEFVYYICPSPVCLVAWRDDDDDDVSVSITPAETIWLSSQSEQRPSGSVANPSRAPARLLLWAMMVQNVHLFVIKSY